MVNYRRTLVPGGTYFFTVTLLDRSSTLLVDHIDELREAFRRVQLKRPFEIDSIVILPDHIHCMWTLPQGDVDYALRWREIKSAFSRRILPGEYRSQGRIKKKNVEFGNAATGSIQYAMNKIWKNTWTIFTSRSCASLRQRHLYIHAHRNPVKHGHVACAADWPYSSFHRFVQKGVYSSKWGINYKTVSGSFGE